MRNKLASVVLLAATLGFGAAAMAATPTNTMGTIKTIDAKTMSVTLDDGSTYKLPKTVKLSSFKVGEKVKVEWAAKGTEKDASSMTPAS